MTEDTRTAWQKRLGVGERQPRDSVVTDGTRTHTRAVENQIVGGVAGTQTEHRSGRLDAKVKPLPAKLQSSVRLPGQKD